MLMIICEGVENIQHRKITAVIKRSYKHTINLTESPSILIDRLKLTLLSEQKTNDRILECILKQRLSMENFRIVIERDNENHQHIPVELYNDIDTLSIASSTISECISVIELNDSQNKNDNIVDTYMYLINTKIEENHRASVKNTENKKQSNAKLLKVDEFSNIKLDTLKADRANTPRSQRQKTTYEYTVHSQRRVLEITMALLILCSIGSFLKNFVCDNKYNFQVN
ncbi:hypothetical protein GJ496_009472 [Pomphorhynchus laevis]|nr:hypothetical protein GJ496_009472 [Pomphorhynchus laevis]